MTNHKFIERHFKGGMATLFVAMRTGMTRRMATNNVAMPPLAVVLFCCAFALLAAGCGGGPVGPSEPLAQLNSTAEFNTTVLDSRKPVVVLFYKEGCPACAKMEGLLGQLAAEYHGRALFVKYPMANPLGIVRNSELHDKYNVYVWPTAMLFFDEVEKKRWLTNDFPADEFRKSLDEILSIRREAGGRITE